MKSERDNSIYAANSNEVGPLIFCFKGFSFRANMDKY